MIPAPPEIPRPVPRGPNPAVPPSHAPQSRAPQSVPRAVSCPAQSRAPQSRAHPGSASPQPSRHKLAPRLTTQTSPTLPPRPKRFRPTTPPRSVRPHPTSRQFLPALPPVPGPCQPPLGGAPFHPRLTTRTLRHASSPARACALPPAPCAMRLRPPVPAPFHPRQLTPLCPSYARRLSRAVDYTCASRSAPCLPRPPHTTTRWGTCRSNNSMNVTLYLIDSVERHIHGKSARGVAWRLGLAVDVRMAQRVVPVRGSRLVPVRGADWYRSGGADWYRSGDQTGPRGASLGIVPSTPPDGPVGDSEDPAPSVGNVKSRPFGESYRTVRWAGSRGYEPGSGRGRACMATLELRILRRFAWSCG
jgi:hypothetical protein